MQITDPLLNSHRRKSLRNLKRECLQEVIDLAMEEKERHKGRRLTIRLHDGGSIAIQADAPENTIPFDRFGELLCRKPETAEDENAPDVELVVSGEMPEKRHVIRNTGLTEIAYMDAWSRILIAGWKKTPRREHYYRCYVWQSALIYAGMNALLRGENAVLIHCAVLETVRGALLIFGESGMGKSTAFRRWRADGRKGFSDDMALLDLGGNEGIHVRRMPTWSACREEKNEWNYPSNEELPLTGVLALGRSETGQDEIAALSPAQFFAQCYRSIFYWNLFYAKVLPEEKQRFLVNRIRTQTEIITGMFPPRALLTVPEGASLAELIEEYL